MQETITLQKVVHFPRGGMFGDYEYVTIEKDGKVLKRYDDYYHDKGEEKADGYLDGYLAASKCDIEIEVYHTDDGENYDEIKEPVQRELIMATTLEYV